MLFNQLFNEIKIGDLVLPHRIVMAPLTRSRAGQPGDVPNALNAEYYRQRSSAALIITEATHISQQGKGYAFTPGIYSPSQVAGWKQVTDAVHAEQGNIFLQLWHVGRISHSSLQPDQQLPVAPSAIPAEGYAFTEQGKMPFETPRELSLDELPGIVEQYKKAAINAKLAGFDGIEIHAANGYLLDQFLKSGSNHRTDHFGGSIENRCRLTLDVIEAVTDVWGRNRVGVRISPTNTFNSMTEPSPQALFNFLVKQLNQFDLAYLHVVEVSVTEPTPTFDFQELRRLFKGIYMANGGYSANKADNSLLNGNCDLVSFGTDYIANPDLTYRIKDGHKLNPVDNLTLYGGGSKGYTDYPTREK